MKTLLIIVIASICVMGQTVIKDFEKENNVKWNGESYTSFSGLESYHRFIMNDTKVLSCPMCNSRPVLTRYYYDIHLADSYSIACEACGWLRTTKGNNLPDVISLWNTLVKRESKFDISSEYPDYYMEWGGDANPDTTKPSYMMFEEYWKPDSSTYRPSFKLYHRNSEKRKAGR